MNKKVIAWIAVTILTFIIGLWPVGLIVLSVGGIVLIVKYIARTAAKEVYAEQEKVAQQTKASNAEADYQRWKAERKSRED